MVFIFLCVYIDFFFFLPFWNLYFSSDFFFLLFRSFVHSCFTLFCTFFFPCSYLFLFTSSSIPTLFIMSVSPSYHFSSIPSFIPSCFLFFLSSFIVTHSSLHPYFLFYLLYPLPSLLIPSPDFPYFSSGRWGILGKQMGEFSGRNEC